MPVPVSSPFPLISRSLLARESCLGVVFGRRKALGALRGGWLHDDTTQRLRAIKRILIYSFSGFKPFIYFDDVAALSSDRHVHLVGHSLSNRRNQYRLSRVSLTRWIGAPPLWHFGSRQRSSKALTTL
jgi:hypothetical protein